jgi:hypothetical protein
MTSPGPLPEARQCADTSSVHYGATAVAAGTFTTGANRWGIMHPINGGYWATDPEVQGWKVLA